MKGGRYLLTDLLVCLPLFVVLVLTGFLYYRSLPVYEAAEDARLVGAYYRVAVSVCEGEAKGVREYSREGRRREGALGRGSWGYEARGDGQETFVWYRAPKAEKVRGVVVLSVRRLEIRRFAVLGAVFVILLLVILTDIGLNRFRRFARERDDFLSATTHDLTTPLVALRRLIGRDDKRAAVLTERMIRLVRNLNDFLRLGSKPPQPKMSEFNLRECYNEAYSLFKDDFRDVFEGHDIETLFEGDAAAEGALNVEADRGMVEQIFWNLLSNALKYAAPYGAVRVLFASAKTWATVTVADEGPGLKRGERRRIFARYYRAKGTKESGRGGFGVGLSTARAMARAMGGELAAKANGPHGTLFVLTLRRN